MFAFTICASLNTKLSVSYINLPFWPYEPRKQLDKVFSPGFPLTDLLLNPIMHEIE